MKYLAYFHAVKYKAVFENLNFQMLIFFKNYQEHMKKLIQRVLNKIGLKLIEYPDKSQKRYNLIMKSQGINTILDIGANTGQFGQAMRKLGFRGRIISFEPVTEAFDKLVQNASSDENWVTLKYALGEDNGTSLINISGNSQSSSILEMLPQHIESAPASKYVAQEEIEIKTLDSVFDDLNGPDAQILLKVDTPGFEKSVLNGAASSLAKISVIELELSLVPLYENGNLYTEMIEYLDDKGFDLYSFEEVFADHKTGRLLQFDGIFVNRNK